MYTSVFLSLMAASMAAAQQFTVASATGALVQCQPYRIMWSGGVAPYYPSITKAGDTASVLMNFDQTSETSVLWTVDQPVGEKVTFAVRDSTGIVQASAPSTAILAGTSNDCLNGSSSAAAGGSSSAAPSSAPASSSSMASSSSASSSSASSSSAPSSSSARPPASTMSPASPSMSAPASDDNAAMNLRSGAALAAGLVGVVAAALI